MEIIVPLVYIVSADSEGLEQEEMNIIKRKYSRRGVIRIGFRLIEAKEKVSNLN